MPIQVQFNGTSLLLPGAYSRTQVELNPGNPFASAGIVGIIGEASGGAPGSTDGVQTFSINQIFDIAQKYRSGPIVKAARALAEPAKDPDVPSGASLIRIYKTNSSTAATALITNEDDSAPATMLNVTSANFGLPENQVNFYDTEGSVPDVQANITSDTITLPLSLTNPQTMVLNINGVAYTFTVPVAGQGPHATVAAILAVLNDAANWAPSKPVIASDATAGGNAKIKLTLDISVAPFLGYAGRHEYTIMYVVAASGVTGADIDLKFRTPIAFASNGLANGTFTVAALGSLAIGSKAIIIDANSPALIVRVTDISGAGPFTITVDNGNTSLVAYTTAQSAKIETTYSKWSDADLIVTEGSAGFVRGSRGNRIFIIKKNTDLETVTENANNVFFRILYKGPGTASTITIRDVAGLRRLQTTCTGAAGDDFDIDLSQFVTIQQLVDFINNFNSGESYICVTDFFNAGTVSPLKLDYLNTVDIRTLPLELKGAIDEIVTNINTQSQFMTVEQVSNVYGQVIPISSNAKVFLSGGATGGSSNNSFQLGYDAMLKERCNIVVPLVSQDAADDIADGNTDATSTYTILSIHAQTDAHARLASNTQNRSERNTYTAIKGSFANAILASKALNSEYTSLAIQDIRSLDENGSVVWNDPWLFAVIAAGMQAGSEVGTPLTHKFMNALGIRHQDFDPKTQYNQAILNGILFAQQPDFGGIRITVGNTTYLRDANPVFNRISVFEIANYVSYDLRQQLENAFIGKTRASGTSLAVAIQTFTRGVLSGYTRAGLLTPDAKNKGLGYRNVTVNVVGGVVMISAIITPAPGIDFVLADLTLAQVNDAA